MSSGQYTLGRNERLTSRKQIEQLFKEGKNFHLFPFRIYYIQGKEQAGGGTEDRLKFGVGVSSRNFKRAVDRNRIKRLIREAYRKEKNGLKMLLQEKGQLLHVFFLYTGKELPDHTIVNDKVKLALTRLVKMVHENSAQDT